MEARLNGNQALQLRLIGLAVEMYRMKRLWNFLETRTHLIQQKITEKVSLYTNNT